MEQELLDAFREIDYVCSGDHSRQGAMVLGAAGEAPRPLLVALHTWSFDFRHPSARGFAERCAERNWHLIFPNFRGPNNHPEGCGSELAVSDIVDAVRYMCERFPVDESRVYLTGGVRRRLRYAASGGAASGVVGCGFSLVSDLRPRRVAPAVQGREICPLF